MSRLDPCCCMSARPSLGHMSATFIICTLHTFESSALLRTLEFLASRIHTANNLHRDTRQPGAGAWQLRDSESMNESASGHNSLHC